jgi:hypothetical protein
MRSGFLHDGDGIVVEDRGNVFRWKLIRGIAYKQTGLADCTVAYNNAPKSSTGQRLLVNLQ